MSDYISKDAAIKVIEKEISKGEETIPLKALLSWMKDRPAADVAPVVHARCIVNCDGDTSCSNCGEKWVDPTKNYCPECGARLDLEAVYE